MGQVPKWRPGTLYNSQDGDQAFFQNDDIIDGTWDVFLGTLGAGILFYAGLYAVRAAGLLATGILRGAALLAFVSVHWALYGAFGPIRQWISFTHPGSGGVSC